MKPTWIDLIMMGLATFRLSLLTSKESGPARIFRKIRKLPPPKSSAREGLSCLWCSSMYAAPAVVAISFLGGRPGAIFILALSVSALAIIINQQWTKDKQ